MRLIDANALLETIEKHCYYQVCYDRTSVEMSMSLAGIRQMISKQPEAVVRCRDCKHYKWEATRCLTFNVPMREDGFCSLTGRRTDG